MITAEIITIGTEIIMGQIMDTNAHYIAKVLTSKGIRVLFRTSIGDDKRLLKSVLKIALNRANLIITTGGLGPTTNDITREAVSELFDIPLKPYKNADVRSTRIAYDPHSKTHDKYNKQNFIPAGSCVILNDNGTAPGFALRHGQSEIICLPGVPREMQSMLNKYLEIYTLKHKSEDACTLTRNLNTFGISECIVENILKNYTLENEHTEALTLVHDGIVTISLLTTAKTREHAALLLDDADRDIRKELGHVIFGIDDMGLEHAVALLLTKYHKTIAVAESCTGGLISDKLTNIPGISEFFLEGVVAYSNKAKVDVLGVPEDLILKHGAVSSQVALAMAEVIKKRSMSDIGIGITGIAGPTGATAEKPVGLVYVAIVIDNFTEVKECRFRGSRIDVKSYSANTALNMVRIKLMGI